VVEAVEVVRHEAQPITLAALHVMGDVAVTEAF
jgi:hypothetical protein